MDSFGTWSNDLYILITRPSLADICAHAIATPTVSHLVHNGQDGPARPRLHALAGASLRETCAKHVLEHLESMCRAAHLPRLAKQHRSELRRGMTAYLRRQLVAAKPDPFRGSQVASSACGDSPRSARSLASSRPGKPIFISEFI